MPANTGVENRRSPRILRRVSLLVDPGTGPAHEAYSAVINVHGALVIAPLGFPDDTVIRLENLKNGATIRARVIWSGGVEAGTGFKLGVEFLDGVDFWGEDYDPDAAG
jgi:PilZ domain